MNHPTPQRVSFRSASPEEIADFWETTLGWKVVFDGSPCRPAGTCLDTATLGGLSTGRQRGSIGYTGYSEASDSYAAWVTTSGRSMYQRGDAEYASAPNHLLVSQPGVLHRVVKADAGADSTYLALESWVLERHLENLLDRPISGPVALAPVTKLQLSAGHDWLSMLQLLNATLLSSDSRLVHPAFVDPLCEAMLTSLLLSVDHQYRDALARPAPPCRPRHVRRAVDAIHAYPERPHTVATLADLAGVSVRTLQQGFRAHFDTSPMAYLRHVRLACAHEELRRDGTVGVAEVACRWGFTHLGRFAAAYAKQYGHLPSNAGPRARPHGGEPATGHE